MCECRACNACGQRDLADTRTTFAAGTGTNEGMGWRNFIKSLPVSQSGVSGGVGRFPPGLLACAMQEGVYMAVRGKDRTPYTAVMRPFQEDSPKIVSSLEAQGRHQMQFCMSSIAYNNPCIE